MRLRRNVAATTAALVAAATLVSCASGAGGEQTAASIVPELSKDQEVEIVFESYNLIQAGAWTDTVNQLLEEFQAEHPNITVKAQPPQGDSTSNFSTSNVYVGSIQTQLLAGKAPDLAQITFDSLDFAVNQLGAKPISDLVSNEELEEAFGGENPMHPNAKVLADWNGKTVGMPYVFSTPVLFYNADMLAQAGVTNPDFSTWDSVEKIAAQVSAQTGKPSLDIPCVAKGGNWCMQALFKSNGAEVLSEDRTTIEFGSAEAQATVERFAEMTEAGVLRSASSTSSMEGLPKGDTAMVLTSSALQGMFMAGASAGGWKLDAAPMPAFPGKEAVPVNSGSALFVLSDDPAKQRASWELAKFLTSDRAYELISSKIGYLPLRTGLVEEGGSLHEWAQANPLIQPNLDQLDQMQPWVSYPGNNFVQVDDILGTAIEEVVFYGKPAEATMTEAQKRAQELIK